MKQNILEHFEGGSIVDWCNPNRHGPLALVKALDGGSDYLMAWFTYEEDPDGWDPDIRDFASESEARAFYEERKEHLRETPNWEAQAEYDAIWGEPPQRWWEEA